ncbi:MAG: alpha/beta hydrolase [Ottowia sp.]|nr:alpha/beta hydrolase [Ottowia sp.]
MKIKAGTVALEVEDTGGSGPAVLLIMGLGMQLTAWPDELVAALADAGYRVIRHDNRDAGLSQYFDGVRSPGLFSSWLRLQVGLPLRPPYTLADMAGDVRALLDALDVAQAHVVGASMGGMIAQRLALAAPERVRSLTSLMSSSGARGLPGPTRRVMRVMMARPPAHAGDAAVAHYVRLLQLLAGPDFPRPDAQLRQDAASALARAWHPQGTRRQMLAVAADTERAHELARLRVPTLVVHGRDDPLLPLACGVDTAQRIPGARLEVVDGMGHDLPPALVPVLAPLLLQHFERSGGSAP